MEPNGRTRILKWAVCAMLLTTMALCPRLWQVHRSFPTIGLIPAAPWLNLAVAILFIGSIVWIAACPKPRPAIFTALALGGILVLFDVTRLQPWFYQALLLLLALAGKEKSDWRAAAVVLAATYFWSGIQKMNLSFGGAVFPWLVHPLGLDFLHPSWFIAPVFEAAVGVLLVFPRTRAWGLAGAVLIHGFLLLALGPLGRNFNSVVWPWNLFMPAMTFAMFFRNGEPLFPLASASLSTKAMILVAGVMPAFYFVGLWGEAFSNALYSGRTPQAFLILTRTALPQVPPDIRPFIVQTPDRVALDLSRWALADLNVPPYPATWAYKKAARQVVRRGVSADELTLIVSARPGIADSRAEFSVVPFEE